MAAKKLVSCNLSLAMIWQRTYTHKTAKTVFSHLKRARSSIIFMMSMILRSTVQRFFVLTLKKGQKPETFVFFENIRHFLIFLYRVSPYQLKKRYSGIGNLGISGHFLIIRVSYYYTVRLDDVEVLKSRWNFVKTKTVTPGNNIYILSITFIAFTSFISSKFQTPFLPYKLSYYAQGHLWYYAWAICHDIRSCENLSLFEHKLKTYLFKNFYFSH